MKNVLADGAFKPKPTTAEAKGDATTRAALTIINGEAAAREAKTERLRKARLAQEALEAAPAPKKKPPTTVQKRIRNPKKSQTP